MKIVRSKWPVKQLTNSDIAKKYNNTWRRNLRKAFPQLPGITPRIARKIFAHYSYHYFSNGCFINSTPAQSSLARYISYVLGHADYGDVALHYEGLLIRPKPKLKLFGIGKSITIKKKQGM